jgi:hypothetical protein
MGALISTDQLPSVEIMAVCIALFIVIVISELSDKPFDDPDIVNISPGSTSILSKGESI